MTPALHALALLESRAQLRASVKAAFLTGRVAGGTTLGTAEAPSIIEDPSTGSHCPARGITVVVTGESCLPRASDPSGPTGEQDASNSEPVTAGRDPRFYGGRSADSDAPACEQVRESNPRPAVTSGDSKVGAGRQGRHTANQQVLTTAGTPGSSPDGTGQAGAIPADHLSFIETPSGDSLATTNGQNNGGSHGAAEGEQSRLHTSAGQPAEMIDCASCGASMPPGAASPDPDPECSGLWCPGCVVAVEKFRNNKE